MNERVLRYVNQLRVARGREPLERLPRGETHTGDRCPLAKALPDAKWVTSSGVLWHGGGRTILPDYVSEAIRRYDDGEFPELQPEETK